MRLSISAFAIKKSLRRSGFGEPIQMIGIMLLFTIGVVAFPTRQIVELFYKGGDEFILMLATGVERIVFFAVMLVFMLQFGFHPVCGGRRAVDFLTVVPAFVIAVNNFPFVSFLSGDCTVAGGAREIALFAVWCVGVGLLEETAYRGIILPLTYVAIKKIKPDGKLSFLKKRPVFFSLAISSALFALSHLINLFSGNVGGTFLQVGYTFLIGAMCGIVTVKTGNVFLAALTHTAYNFFGMIVEYCGRGVMWTLPQTIFTAAVGVCLGGFLLAVAFLTDRKEEDMSSILGGDDLPDFIKTP